METQTPETKKLKDVLTDPDLCNIFREFLETCLCAENLFFYLEVAKYKDEFGQYFKERDESLKPSFDGVITDFQVDHVIKESQKKLLRRINDIYDIYFRKNSPYQINLPGRIVTEIRQFVESLETEVTKATEEKVDIKQILSGEATMKSSTPQSVQDQQQRALKALQEIESKSFTLFDKAQHVVFSLMRDDSLQNFLKSDVYNNYLNSLNNPKPGSFIEKKKIKKESSKEKDSSSQLSTSPPSSSSFSPSSSSQGSYGIHNVNAKAKKFFGNTFAVLRKTLEKEHNHPEETPIMSTFMPDEFAEFSHGAKPVVLTDKEIDEMKAMIHKAISRIIAYKPEAAPTNNNNSAIPQDHPARLTDDESDQIHFFFKTADARNEFAVVLSQQRSNACLSDDSFETLWRLLKVALIQADISNEYTTAKLLMHMSATYYRENADSTKEYIQNKLKNIEIWKKPRFWEFAFYDSVSVERNKMKPKKDWKDMTQEEQEEFHLREKSIFFGQMGSFAMLMLSFGVPVEDVRAFLTKQCIVNGLSDDQRNALLVNLNSLASSVIYQDLVSNAAKQGLKAAQPTPSEMLKQEHENLKKKRHQLEKKIEAINTQLSLRAQMKDWLATKSQIEEQKINQQFNELRELLDKKQEEILQDMRAKMAESTQSLEQQTQELMIAEDTSKQAMESLDKVSAEIDSLLPQSQSENLDVLAMGEAMVKSQRLEKILVAHLNFSEELTKPSQLLTQDFNFHLNITPQKNALNALGTKSKLSIVRWRVNNWSDLANVNREPSCKIRLHGFNWRLIMHPNGLPESPEYLALYLEFVDAVNAVGFTLRVKFIMRLINQQDSTITYNQGVITFEFGAENPRSGYPKFIKLSDLAEKNWVLNDSMLFEVEIFDVEVLDPNLVQGAKVV